MHHALSLWSAVRININIMLGTGLFINTVNLAHLAGPLGALSYAAVGVILFPLIITIARLTELHPQGGFYKFGASEINPLAGFLSAWIYFAGKLASATLMIHASTTLMRLLSPTLMALPHLMFDAVIIGLFALLNLCNMKMGNIIQTVFFSAKMVPIILILAISAAWYAPANYAVLLVNFEAFITTIPLVLYATIGFEAACSLSTHLENPKVNGPRAILISYSSLIIVYCLFQAGLYGLLGSQLGSLNSFAEVFQAVATFVPASIQPLMGTLLILCVALSALGGAYGILFSNMWNLHALAEHGHIWGSAWLKKLSRHTIPAWCVAVEGILCCSYLFLSQGTQLPLQQISGLGSVIAYTISCVAAYYAKKQGTIRLSWPFIYIALINCLMLTALCMTYLIKGGNPALYLFIGLIIAGIGMFLSQGRKF
jgi:amino acid transporter